LHTPHRWLLPVICAAIAGCRGPASHAESNTIDPSQVARWAHAIDSLATTAHGLEFSFPSRSIESGGGRLYKFADGSLRVDIDDFGEMGKHRERYYAQAKAGRTDLRLAIAIDDLYDRPMSGRVIRSTIDSTWFDGDTASRWVDSLRVAHIGSDSSMRAHGAEVFGEFLWAMRMAGTTPADSTLAPKSFNER
jgi:hypothetical protein